MPRAFWERYAASNPYYAVVSTPAFLGHHLDEATRADFFRTGTEHIDALWTEIERSFVPGFRPRRALDFGCGVGRVTLALAARCDHVLGVDIASGMVDEARTNSKAFGVSNATFVRGGDAEGIEGDFDLVHSMVVLQHVPPRHGYPLFAKLVSLVRPGGLGALHVTYADPSTWSQRVRRAIYARWPGLHALRRRMGQTPCGPVMPMYTYDVGRLLSMLKSLGCAGCRIQLTDHGHKGALIIFQRER